MDLLRLFLEKYQHEQAVVLEYLQNKNYDAAIETLHKLAGAAGMLALKALREAALNLENSITIKANSDAESQGYQATHIATMKTLQHLLCIDYSLGSVEIQ
jgi:HPt (histidine-containing phosphotransfer) domain-containing protein